MQLLVVQNIKDTIFWKQFTTPKRLYVVCFSCSEYQRYNFLKAIHNQRYDNQTFFVVVQNIKDTIFWKQFTTQIFQINFRLQLFRISKIQFFESNSQRCEFFYLCYFCCSEYQRYNFLKAIHNFILQADSISEVVQNIKDTIFWKQFTTSFTHMQSAVNVVQNIKDTIFWKQFTTIKERCTNLK